MKASFVLSVLRLRDQSPTAQVDLRWRVSLPLIRRTLWPFQSCVVPFALVVGTRLTVLHQPPPQAGSLGLIMSIILSSGLCPTQVGALLRSSSRHRVAYADNVVYTWYDNGVEDITELDEALGSDDGENFDYDGNLDT